MEHPIKTRLFACEIVALLAALAVAALVLLPVRVTAPEGGGSVDIALGLRTNEGLVVCAAAAAVAVVCALSLARRRPLGSGWLVALALVASLAVGALADLLVDLPGLAEDGDFCVTDAESYYEPDLAEDLAELEGSHDGGCANTDGLARPSVALGLLVLLGAGGPATAVARSIPGRLAGALAAAATLLVLAGVLLILIVLVGFQHLE